MTRFNRENSYVTLPQLEKELEDAKKAQRKQAKDIAVLRSEIESSVAGVSGVKGDEEQSYRTGNVNITAGNVGAVPTSRTVNSKALSSDITLGASDVSAVALSDKYTRSSAGTLDWTNTTDGDAKVIAKSALAFWNGAYNGTSSNLAYCNKGAFGTLATKNSLSASDVGAVPTSRTVNSKALSSNITLSASDVGAFPKSDMTRGISMVSTIPSDGKLTLNNTDIGGSRSAKIQGVLAIPQYSNGVTVKHNYDASSTSQVVLNFYKADGSAYSGAMRYFLITFPNTWTP
jgi:hypothetical protein